MRLGPPIRALACASGLSAGAMLAVAVGPGLRDDRHLMLLLALLLSVLVTSIAVPLMAGTPQRIQHMSSTVGLGSLGQSGILIAAAVGLPGSAGLTAMAVARYDDLIRETVGVAPRKRASCAESSKIAPPGSLASSSYHVDIEIADQRTTELGVPRQTGGAPAQEPATELSEDDKQPVRERPGGATAEIMLKELRDAHHEAAIAMAREIQRLRSVPASAKQEAARIEQWWLEVARLESAERAAIVAETSDAIARPPDGHCTLVPVYFLEPDSSNLDKLMREAISYNVACLAQKGTAVNLRITGFTPPFATEEYNLALGDRRARSVEQYTSSLGFEKTRIGSVSMGEEHSPGPKYDLPPRSFARDARVEFTMRE